MARNLLITASVCRPTSRSILEASAFVRVEALPWATGKHRLTDAYAWFLAGWAKRLSWQEVAAAFPTSWDTVHRAVRMAVDWGLAHRDLTNIEAIGVDELSAPPRATLPDVGLSDRRPLQTPAVGRTRTQGRDLGRASSTGSAPHAARRCTSCARTCGSPT